MVDSSKPHRTFIIDATMISTFRACEWKYKLRMNDLWVSKYNNGALGSGLAFHEAGARFRELRRDGKPSDLCYFAGAAKLREVYPKYMPPEFSASGPIPDERRSLPNLERIFEAWCRYESRQNFKYLYIEQSGGITLGSIERSTEIVDIVYSVIIDAIVELQGCIFVNDIKTTTMNVTQPFKDSFKLSQQLMGYVVAGHELIGRPIYGSMASITWFQKQGKEGGKSKSVDEYFHTVPITYTQPQLDEWHTNTLLTINKILDCEESNQWQMDLGDSCKMYNGCTFKNVCSANPNSRLAMLKMDFEKATWTPLEEIRSRKVELDV